MNHYTLIDYPIKGNQHGLYSAKSPKRAASKAFTRLIKQSNNSITNTITNNHKRFIVFTIKNLHTNKNYTYAGTRVKLNNPIVRTLPNNKSIVYKYKNVLIMEKNL